MVCFQKNGDWLKITTCSDGNTSLIPTPKVSKFNLIHKHIIAHEQMIAKSKHSMLSAHRREVHSCSVLLPQY